MEKEIKTISKKLKPLMKEARKYKSVEEFIEVLWQKNILPFGKREEDVNEPTGTYLSPISVSGAIIEGEPIKAVIFKPQKPYYIELINMAGEYWKDVLLKRFGGLTGQQLSDALKKRGYDAVMATGIGGGKNNIIEAVALDRNSVKFFEHPKQPIRDFYNQVIKK